MFGAMETLVSMTSSESSREWKNKRKSPPREQTQGFGERKEKKEQMLGRAAPLGVNSGVVDSTQCEILSLNVQGIVPVKE